MYICIIFIYAIFSCVYIYMYICILYIQLAWLLTRESRYPFGISMCGMYIHMHVYVYTHACIYMWMYVCIRMYVCIMHMHVRTYECILYVCVYVCIYVWVHVCILTCMYVYTYACMYRVDWLGRNIYGYLLFLQEQIKDIIIPYMRVCVYKLMYACLWVWIFGCVCVCVCVHTHSHTHTHTSNFRCVCVCVSESAHVRTPVDGGDDVATFDTCEPSWRSRFHCLCVSCICCAD